MKLHKFLLTPPIVAISAALFCGALFGDTNNYTGANNGDWFTDSNWSLKHAPMADEDVTLTKAVTVKANGSISVKSITVTTGTLDISNASDDPAFAVNVSGDVTLSGTGKMYVRAGKTTGINAKDWEASAAKLWANRNKVNIGGKLTVGSGATLYSANHQETGTPVVFNCAELVVEKGGTISTKALGNTWVKADAAPEGAVVSSKTGSFTGFYTFAFGSGNSYNSGPGYGGAGNSPNYGKVYGYPYAPFLSGSPAGVHNDNASYNYPASGSIVLLVSGHAEIAGTVTAIGANTYYGAASGGGIWLCSATADITESAYFSVEGAMVTGSYSSSGPGGRLCLGFGLSETDIAALAAGATAVEGLTYTDLYGVDYSCLGGKGYNGNGARAKSGTAKLVYRSSVSAPRFVTGSPSNMGEVSPGYGFHAFAANDMPAFTGPDGIYLEAYRNQCRFGTVEKDEPTGDQPTVTWRFSGEQYLLRVQLVGTGSVSVGGVAKAADFEQWIDAGETITLSAAGDFTKWTGDFAGGVTDEATLALTMDSPRLVQTVFADAVGTERAYVGEAGGFWDMAENWDPAGVPTPLDDLTVPAGAFVRGANTLAAKSLTVAGYLALGGETKDATTAQKFTDIPKGWYGLLADDLAVSGGLSVGSRTQTCSLSGVTIGGNVTLSAAGKLAVYAPEQAGVITSPYDEVYANRMVVSIGGDFTVSDTAVLYPIADQRTGTPIVWEIAGDFSLAAGASVNATGLGFAWTTVNDPRKTQTAALSGIDYFSLSPGSPTSGHAAGGCYGGGSRAYGFATAPFLPGAPSSIYNSNGPGGGVVWVHALGQVSLSGTVAADASARKGASQYSGGAGGSIWILGKKIVAESTASLSAKGAKQTHSDMTGAGSGGRIALGVGLTDAQIAALAAGTATEDIEGVRVQENITLVTASVRGGEYTTKGAGNVTVYGDSGTLMTVSGASADVVVTVAGTPVAPFGEDGPAYGPCQCPQGEPVTFMSSSVASLAKETETIRYNLKGWVVSNETEEVARGTGTTATFTPGKDALTLYWLWGGRETRSVAAANNPEFGSVLVNGEASETGAAWTHETDEVTFTAVPADAEHEFLCWIGDVPFGETLKPELKATGMRPRRLTAVFRTNEVACTRTWIGKALTRGEWLDPTKWSPAGVPGRDDDVIITQGTVDATNVLAVGSLTIGGAGIVWVGANATPNNVAQDVNLYMSAYLESKTALDEILVSVKRDFVLEGKGQITVGTRDQVYHSTVNVGGDLLLNGTNILQIAAGRIENDFTLQTGAGWVNVGGAFKVGGKSVVYPICEGYTGGTVVFRADSFTVESNATVNATASGYSCLLSRSPAYLAPGAGTEYTVGGGYGGYGLRDAKLNPYDQKHAGKTYGQAYAPIHPGSPLGGWGGGNDWGGGLIRVHAQSVRIDGTLNARASVRTDKTTQNQRGGSGSGGGIWVTCAGTPEIGPTARFLAPGAPRATDAGNAGGGGRIAVAAHVTDAQVAELAETGTVAAWKPKGWHFQNQAKFEAKYPGVKIDLAPGEQPAAEYLELTTGTFWYLEGNDIGLMLLVK